MADHRRTDGDKNRVLPALDEQDCRRNVSLIDLRPVLRSDDIDRRFQCIEGIATQIHGSPHEPPTAGMPLP